MPVYKFTVTTNKRSTVVFSESEVKHLEFIEREIFHYQGDIKVTVYNMVENKITREYTLKPKQIVPA